MSSPFTIGFPAMTAWFGFVHALQRKLNQAGFDHLKLTKTAVSCHQINLQTYRGEGDFASIVGTANLLDKDGSRPSFIEEARCHLEVSLLIELKGRDPDEDPHLITKLNKLLAQMKIASGNLFILGKKLRLFAKNISALERLNLSEKLNRLMDYVHVSSIKLVPSQIKGFVRVGRYRPKASSESLARRRAKSKDISLDEAHKHFETRQIDWKDMPFIQLKSQTTDKDFSLCIDQKTVDSSQSGLFSIYGLSAGRTVPHW